MSFNACSINRQTIDAACGLFSVLTSSIVNYTVTIVQGATYAPTDIGDFFGGPITSIVTSSGAINGPGGALGFSADPGVAGNIYFGGLVTNTIGAYTGQVRLYGTINFVVINFTINIVAATVGGGEHQHVHPDTKVPLNIFRRAPDEEPIVDVKTIEMPFVEVNVEFMGARYAQTLERSVTDDIAMVTIFGFSAPSDGVSVNISDIRITRIT